MCMILDASEVICSKTWPLLQLSTFWACGALLPAHLKWPVCCVRLLWGRWPWWGLPQPYKVLSLWRSPISIL